jgi:hypothetical protein
MDNIRTSLTLFCDPNRLMRSVGLWRWYINRNVTVLYVIHRNVFYLKHSVLETAFSLRLQVGPAQLSHLKRKTESNLLHTMFQIKYRTIDDVRIVIVTLTYHRYKQMNFN